MTSIARWSEFSGRLSETAVRIVGEAEISTDPDHKPQLLSALLLARTIANHRGVVELVQRHLVVEARILARCCFENMFWIAGLVRDRDAFVNLMLDDEMKSRQSRGKALFADKVTRTALDSDAEAKLRGWLTDAGKRFPDARYLTPKAVAFGTSVASAYHLYSQLSSDAAHPSIEALDRHAPGPEATIDIAPVAKTAELEDTLNLAANAFLGACVGANEMLKTPAGENLSLLADEYNALDRNS